MTTIDKTNYLFNHHHPAQAVQINARGEQDRAGYNENNPCLQHVIFFNEEENKWKVQFRYEYSGPYVFDGRSWQ